MAIWYFLFRRHQIIGKLDEGSECVLSEAAFMSTAEQASKTLITSLSWHLTASMNTVSPSLFLSSHRIFRQQPEAVNIAHSYGTLGECHPDVGLYFEVNVVTA